MRRSAAISFTQVRSSRAQLDAAAPLLDDGTVGIVLEESFPLSHAAEAHARAAQGHIQGKIVLTVD